MFADIGGRFFAIGNGDVTVELPDRLGPSPITGFVTMPDGEFVVLTLNEGAFHLLPGA